MSEDLEQTINALEKRLVEIKTQENTIKTAINQFLLMQGKPPKYEEVQTGTKVIKVGQFFGKPFATVAQEYIRMVGNAVSTRELFQALKKGGYKFKGKDEEDQYRGLTIALSKNTQTFVKIGDSDAYGLWEFYPDLKKGKKEQSIQINESKPLQKAKKIQAKKQVKKGGKPKSPETIRAENLILSTLDNKTWDVGVLIADVNKKDSNLSPALLRRVIFNLGKQGKIVSTERGKWKKPDVES